MNPINPSTELNRSWKNLTDEFRSACMLRKQGDSEGAAKILDEKLPSMISRWSRLSPSAEAMKREQLNQMFDRERERIEDAWLTQQILLRQMRDVLIPSLCLQVAEEVREVMELQVSEITRTLTSVTRAPSEPLGGVSREVAPALADEQSTRMVSLRSTPVELSGNRPSFDDLPAIIDELIASDWEGSHNEQRLSVLV